MKSLLKIRLDKQSGFAPEAVLNSCFCEFVSLLSCVTKTDSLLNVGRNVRIRESDLQKRIELQTEKMLLCDSSASILSSLFHRSYVSVLYDFATFLPLFELLGNS